jgi:hypothetical protein
VTPVAQRILAIAVVAIAVLYLSWRTWRRWHVAIDANRSSGCGPGCDCD